jgi:hypothetical protein
MTAKASIASIRCPAIESPSGVGKRMTVTSAATATRTPQFDRNQPGFAAGGILAASEPGIASMLATKFLPVATIGFQSISFAWLVLEQDQEKHWCTASMVSRASASLLFRRSRVGGLRGFDVWI